VKRSTLIGLLAFLTVTGVLGYLFFIGPRMRIQPNIRAFQAVMPPTPQGAVPVEDPLPPLPTTREAMDLVNPLAMDEKTLAWGRVYYGYYCAFCHGSQGRGDGPVGESYLPTPANLQSARVQAMSDGELLLAMLSGTGHKAVLRRVVRPEYRWYLVSYVRGLPRPQAQARPR
jgi:mono/diheme cytochrome c family protein